VSAWGMGNGEWGMGNEGRVTRDVERVMGYVFCHCEKIPRTSGQAPQSRYLSLRGTPARLWREAILFTRQQCNNVTM